VEVEHVPRARVNLDTRGLVKIVAQRSTGHVLGITSWRRTKVT